MGCRIRREESKHCLIKTREPARSVNHLARILPDVRALLLITGWWEGAACCRRFSPEPLVRPRPEPATARGPEGEACEVAVGVSPCGSRRLSGSVLPRSWAFSARQRCGSDPSLGACRCVTRTPRFTDEETEARQWLARSPVPGRGRVRVGSHGWCPTALSSGGSPWPPVSLLCPSVGCWVHWQECGLQRQSDLNEDPGSATRGWPCTSVGPFTEWGQCFSRGSGARVRSCKRRLARGRSQTLHTWRFPPSAPSPEGHRGTSLLRKRV